MLTWGHLNLFWVEVLNSQKIVVFFLKSSYHDATFLVNNS